MYYEGDLSYFEAINKETIKNALSRQVDMGLILLHRGQAPPLQMTPSMTASTANIQTWISVHPDWIPTYALPSFSKADFDTLNEKQKYKIDKMPAFEKKIEDTLSVWYHHRPAGILWDFCEKIGKFRREGKNRRDSQTVASRVLRLARLSRLWVFDDKGKRMFNKL